MNSFSADSIIMRFNTDNVNNSYALGCDKEWRGRG